MKQIAHVHRTHFILLPFHQLQAVFQEMGIGTGGVLLKPGNASLKDISIQCAGRRPADLSVLTAQHSRIDQFFHLIPVFRLGQKIGKKRHKGRFLFSRLFPQSLCQAPDCLSRRTWHRKILFLRLQVLPGKETLQLADEGRWAKLLAASALCRTGQHQLTGRLRHH